MTAVSTVPPRSWFQFIKMETYQVAAATAILLVVQRMLPVRTYDCPKGGLESSAIVVVWCPVMEEVFYRGILESVIRIACNHFNFPCKKWIPTALSSAYFGYRHYENFSNNPWLSLQNVWQAAGLGIWLSLEQQKTQSLFKGIVLHGVINAIEVSFLGLNSKVYYRLYMAALNVIAAGGMLLLAHKVYRES